MVNSMRSDELKAALAKATPGRWSVYPRPEGFYPGIHTDSYQTTVIGTGSGMSEADAELIVLLHNAALDVVAAVEAMTQAAADIASLVTDDKGNKNG